MTEDQKLAHAIGYLRGISAILWNLDKADSSVQFSTEEAAYYDQQIDVLAKAVLRKEDGDGMEDAR